MTGNLWYRTTFHKTSWFKGGFFHWNNFRFNNGFSYTSYRLGPLLIHIRARRFDEQH